MKILITVLFFLFASLQMQAQITATVVDVWDGDSYRIRYAVNDSTFELMTVRLVGADAPEKANPYNGYQNQAYGLKAAEIMRGWLLHQTVSVTPLHLDQYNRMVAQIYKDSIDVTYYMISNGLAWWLKDKSMTPEYLSRLKAAQAAARKARIGLHGEPGREIRPSTFRKRHQRAFLIGLRQFEYFPTANN